MTTNNLDLGSLHDLSSFEPEAILAALPGEHPRAAAAVALGREASQTGYLDVAELSRIANELYAEGFPAGAFARVPEIPSTASLSDARDPLSHQSVNQYVGSLPRSANLPVSGLPLSGLADPSAVNLQHAASLQNELELDALLGNVEIPQQVQLETLFADFGAGSSAPFSQVIQPAAQPGLASGIQAGQGFQPGLMQQPDQVKANRYYFLQESAQADAPSLAKSAHPALDANLVRKDFPILRELVNGRPLIWFDNAATTQKPQAVIDRIAYFYQHENSNIHRAAHELAARATDAYEEARETVRRFINAPSVDNIVFVRGTTEAINLVAKTWGKKHVQEGDEILISHLEHHANIVPWQQLCQEAGAVLKVAPVDASGQILLDEYQKLLTSKVKLVSFTQVSNALGTVTPAAQMIQMAHRVGAKVLLDGAQSVSHMRTDVQGLDADFFVFSGHKVFGPTGIGALYGKADVLDDMPAWQGGGNMIQDVNFDKTAYHEAPAKFEAGTGNIADAVGLGAALQYVERIGIDNIARYEHELLAYATAALNKVPGLRLIGTAQDKASVLSFTLDSYKSEEVGAALNQEGIAVRSGHHCAQPILRRFGVETTVRPSLAFYNTYAEVDVLVNALLKLTSHKAPSGLV